MPSRVAAAHHAASCPVVLHRPAGAPQILVEQLVKLLDLPMVTRTLLAVALSQWRATLTAALDA